MSLLFPHFALNTMVHVRLIKKITTEVARQIYRRICLFECQGLNFRVCTCSGSASGSQGRKIFSVANRDSAMFSFSLVSAGVSALLLGSS